MSRIVWIIVIVLLFQFLFADIAFSQEKKWNYTQHIKGTRPELEISIGYFIFVFAISGISIILVVWLLKKIMNVRFSNSKVLVLKDSLYLGNKTFLHAIEVKGKLFVIGVGSKIDVISEMDCAESAPTANVGIKSSPFEEALTTVITRMENGKKRDCNDLQNSRHHPFRLLRNEEECHKKG